MTLDQELWEALQEHGVTPAHLEMLLRLLQVQRNGSWAWHYVNGQILQCDVRLLFPSSAHEVQRVSETLFSGESVVR